MALTNSPELAQKMGLLRSHGITRDAALMTHDADGPWYYQQLELGFNYRLTDIHAALGASQLCRLDAFVMRRNQLAAQYDQMLVDADVELQHVPTDVLSARHLYVVRVPAERHASAFAFLREHGVGVNLHYIPVHLQPWYLALGFKAGQFPEAESYYSEAISLPMYSTLTNEQQNYVVKIFKEAIA